MQNCELVDVLTQPDWVIAIARITLEASASGTEAAGPDAVDLGLPGRRFYDTSGGPMSADSASREGPYGYRCWVFTPEFTVLDDGEVHPSREAATDSARRLVLDSREL